MQEKLAKELPGKENVFVVKGDLADYKSLAVSTRHPYGRMNLVALARFKADCALCSGVTRRLLRKPQRSLGESWII